MPWFLILLEWFDTTHQNGAFWQTPRRGHNASECSLIFDPIVTSAHAIQAPELGFTNECHGSLILSAGESSVGARLLQIPRRGDVADGGWLMGRSIDAIAPLQNLEVEISVPIASLCDVVAGAILLALRCPLGQRTGDAAMSGNVSHGWFGLSVGIC